MLVLLLLVMTILSLAVPRRALVAFTWLYTVLILLLGAVLALDYFHENSQREGSAFNLMPLLILGGLVALHYTLVAFRLRRSEKKTA